MARTRADKGQPNTGLSAKLTQMEAVGSDDKLGFLSTQVHGACGTPNGSSWRHMGLQHTG